MLERCRSSLGLVLVSRKFGGMPILGWMPGSWSGALDLGGQIRGVLRAAPLVGVLGGENGRRLPQ